MADFREEMRKKYSDLYTSFYHNEQDKCCCFYCGDPADTVDHVPPITRVSDYRALGMAQEQYWRVPACRECNRLAGDSLQDCLISRERHVKSELRRVHKKILNGPSWTNEEVWESDLEGSLRQFVLGQAKNAQILRERLDYQAGVQALIRHQGRA